MKTKSKFSFLTSDPGEFIAASVGGVAITHFQEYKTEADAWRNDFRGGLNDILERQRNEVHSDMDDARSAGVANRWETEEYFAKNPHSEGILGYHDTDGFHLWSSEERTLIQNGDRVQVDGITVEGHHINSISSDPDNFQSATDADNIKFVTKDAHLQEHHGNFQNPTTGETEEVSSIADKIEDKATSEFKSDEMMESIDDILIATSVGSVLQLISLKDDPRPWQQKSFVVLSGALTNTALSATLFVTSFHIQDFIHDSIADFTGELSDSAFDSLLSSAGSVGVAVVVRVGLKAGIALYQGKSLNGDFLASAILSVATSAAISGAAAAAGLDPTGVLLTFTILKFGWDYFKNKQLEEDYRIYNQFQLDYKYERAAIALAA